MNRRTGMIGFALAILLLLAALWLAYATGETMLCYNDRRHSMVVTAVGESREASWAICKRDTFSFPLHFFPGGSDDRP